VVSAGQRRLGTGAAGADCGGSRTRAGSAADETDSRRGYGPAALGGIPDPALGHRVHAGRPDIAEYGPDPGVSEDRVECSGEIRAAVADHEPDLMRLIAQVHEQVACLLGGPRPGGMLRDSDDADAPGRVLDHGQHVRLGAVEQVDREDWPADPVSFQAGSNPATSPDRYSRTRARGSAREPARDPLMHRIQLRRSNIRHHAGHHAP
jgi:hypothetical protein